MWPLARTANPYHAQPASISSSAALYLASTRVHARSGHRDGLAGSSCSKTSLSLVLLACLPLFFFGRQQQPPVGRPGTCMSLPVALASTLALLQGCFTSLTCLICRPLPRPHPRPRFGCRYMKPLGHSAALDSWNLLHRCRSRHHRLC